ncbi:hypothetical protein [Actinomadura roseirufa]|uniref:hypothetical protein n=1 Tax=Actinomadura roseirufa TaxID=2094049 RepID=UPI0013F15021|nr:hypothetical protein [Actinomadura roseirufa]
MALTLLVLGAGLPLLDHALGGGLMVLPAGARLSVGTERDGVRPVSFSVPSAGWRLRKGRSSLGTNAALTRDDVALNLNVVVPLGTLDAGALWDGLQRIVAAGGTARLGSGPAPITTSEGLTGLTGALSGRGRIGTASVFARDTLGATVTASGRPAAYRRLAAQIEAIVRTIRIAP